VLIIWRQVRPTGLGMPRSGAIKQIAWPAVLLVAGVSCFAAVLSEAGAP
jgi:hypothetical protein